MSHSSNSQISTNKEQEVPHKAIESEYDAQAKADFVYLPTLKSMEKPATKKANKLHNFEMWLRNLNILDKHDIETIYGPF